MRIVQPYKHLNKLLLQESFEPAISWGIRMAVAAMVPLTWGLYTGKLVEAGWIALIAECICWVELKGDFQARLKLLAGGSALALFFALLGSITGNVLWLSVLLMAAVGFISSLLKNIGDRGSGLAICVYALFIFCNAYPTDTVPELRERTLLLLTGAAWNAVAAVIASVFVPAQRPFRRSIAIIWKAIADLTEAVSKGWEGTGPRSNEHDIYQKEKAIRAAIDTSLNLFEKMAHEATEKDGKEHTLAQVRKAAAIVGAQVITISEELTRLSPAKMDNSLRIKIFTLLRATQQTLDRLAVYAITLERAEELILRSRISRLNKLCLLLREKLQEQDIPEQQAVLRLVQLTERNTRIIESAFNNLGKMVDDRSMIRSYSMMKTIYILHPKYWWQFLQLLFNFNTFTARYALRSAIAAALAMFIYKFWSIDHGYWIPFTLVIVMQAYFGATLKKSMERIAGTVTGGVVGGLLLRLPTGLYLQEAMLFLSFIPMIYFLRKNYSVAAFFITLNLVLLFNINRELNNLLIITRALSTIAGAAIAIVAGFALLPLWDKKWLPVHLANAIQTNYCYFLTLFYPEENDQPWAKNKRRAESANSNVFDSFNRYMQEPSFRKKPFAIFYYIITHNIRITRELNNIKLEQESKDPEAPVLTAGEQTELLTACLEWFDKNILLLKILDPDIGISRQANKEKIINSPLSQQQVIYTEKMLVELKAMHQDLEILTQKLHRIMQL